MASIPGATAYPAIPPLDKIGNHRGLSVHAAAPLKGFTPEKERVILLKTLTTVASVALPIEERWSIKRCRYAPDGESVGRVCIATGTHGDEMMGQLIVYLVQQRIAAHPGALLDRLKNYRYGVQLTSFYQPGSFVPHVRMMDTGRQNPDLGCEFGLPYVYVRTPRSYDQTTLNYNWQLCGTQAYSLYAGKTREIDEAAADQTLRAIVRFLNSRGVIRSETAPGHPSTIITNADMISVSATSAGLLRRIKFAGAHVRRGEQLAFIINPCDGSVREVLKAPVTGMLFFMQDGPFITEHSPVFQVLAGA